MKKCNKCGETKEFSEFNKCKSHKDGHQSLCRLCTKKHYASVRELRLVSMKEYYEKNKEKLIEDKNCCIFMKLIDNYIIKSKELFF